MTEGLRGVVKPTSQRPLIVLVWGSPWSAARSTFCAPDVGWLLTKAGQSHDTRPQHGKNSFSSEIHVPGFHNSGILHLSTQS